MKKYVVIYDNGSGYMEWACTPQDTPDAAWEISGLRGRTVAGYIPEILEVEEEQD